MFPIQEEHLSPPKGLGRVVPISFPRSVPWRDAERAYKTYAHRYGTSQSLERMAERGGFGANEFVMYYYAALDNNEFWDHAEYYRQRYKLEVSERPKTD